MSRTTSPVIDTTPNETEASESRGGSTAPALGRKEIVLTSGTYLCEDEKDSQPVGENAPSASHDSSPTGNSRSIARQPIYVVPETPTEYYFETLQQWEGTVTDVSDDQFVAILRSLSGDITDKRVTIDCEEVSAPDQQLVLPGAVFYWTIGYRIEFHGQKSSISTIKFRRLPNWTRREIQRLDQVTSKYDFLLK